MRFIERLRQAKVVDLAGYRRVLAAAQRRQALQIVTPADVQGEALTTWLATRAVEFNALNPMRNDFPMPCDTEPEREEGR